jgi:hypothetical protein
LSLEELELDEIRDNEARAKMEQVPSGWRASWPRT